MTQLEQWEDLMQQRVLLKSGLATVELKLSKLTGRDVRVVLRPCPYCQQLFGARELRQHRCGFEVTRERKTAHMARWTAASGIKAVLKPHPSDVRRKVGK